jgi:hypothetical protein
MDFFLGAIIGATITKLYIEHKQRENSHVPVSHPDTEHLDKMKNDA